VARGCFWLPEQTSAERGCFWSPAKQMQQAATKQSKQPGVYDSIDCFEQRSRVQVRPHEQPRSKEPKQEQPASLSISDLRLSLDTPSSDGVHCRLVFECNFGDPICCLFLSSTGTMAGTTCGRVWANDFSTDGELLCSWSEEGVRGLYMDETCCYVISNEGFNVWQRRGLGWVDTSSPVCFHALDMKSTANARYVVQRGPWACVLYQGYTSSVHVSRREHYHRQFKLSDYGTSGEVGPCDFNGETALFVDRAALRGRASFFMVHLEKNETVYLDDLPSVGCVGPPLGAAPGGPSLMKLWGLDCVVYVEGSVLVLYNFRRRQIIHEFRDHWDEIVAVDAHELTALATLSRDGVVKRWSGDSGDCIRTLYVAGASFSLGFPYHLHWVDQRIAVAADEGVFLVNLDHSP